MQKKERPTVLQDLRLIPTYIKMMLTKDPDKQVVHIYELHTPGSLIAENSTFMNVGYWEKDCPTIDEASVAEADLIAKTAGFEPGDTILDCGFGYGDQDFHWLETHDPKQIIGLNITGEHVRAATAAARERGVQDRVDFREGSATKMPIESGSVDRVVALESAFHFFPRTEFFKEAFRVLRPGGTLATADILPLRSDVSKSQFKQVTTRGLTWPIRPENWYGTDEYEQKLAEAGFGECWTRSIQDQTFYPWADYINKRVDDPGFQQNVSKLYLSKLRKGFGNLPELKRELSQLNYILGFAKKPDNA